MKMMTIRDIDVNGKRVLVRVDFNVPVDSEGEITDDKRIRSSMPTIRYLVDRGARIVLASHFGRPKGRSNEKYSLRKIAIRLSQLLEIPVVFIPEVIGVKVEEAINLLKNGDILLLENLRFYPEEEQNDAKFAKVLAGLADVYVDDAFGAAHRAHASIVGVTKYLPSVAGFLLEQEINNLGSLLKNPVRPFAAILGGVKISDKLSLLDNIISRVDYILLGGGMASTFLKFRGITVGKSVIDNDYIPITVALLRKAREYGVEVYLPVDVVIATNINKDAKTIIVPVDKIPDDMMIVDIGPQTLSDFIDVLKKCKTIFWNGPMGVHEIDKFKQGTADLAKKVAAMKATTIIGGGSTAEAIIKLGIEDKMTFISTGGGAALEFLSGKYLPGLEALLHKN